MHLLVIVIFNEKINIKFTKLLFLRFFATIKILKILKLGTPRNCCTHLLHTSEESYRMYPNVLPENQTRVIGALSLCNNKVDKVLTARENPDGIPGLAILPEMVILGNKIFSPSFHYEVL